MNKYSNLFDSVGFSAGGRTKTSVGVGGGRVKRPMPPPFRSTQTEDIDEENGEMEDTLENFVSLPEAIRFLTGFYSQVSAALLEMRRIEDTLRDFVLHKPQIIDAETEKRLKADQCYTNESFIRLRESLQDFMKKSQGVRLL